MRQGLIATLAPHFPSEDDALDVELSRLLVFLRDPGATTKTLALLANSLSASSYATFLSAAKDGWTPEAKANYLAWLKQATAQPGGANYQRYIEGLKAEFLRVGGAKSE